MPSTSSAPRRRPNTTSVPARAARAGGREVVTAPAKRATQSDASPKSPAVGRTASAPAGKPAGGRGATKALVLPAPTTVRGVAKAPSTRPSATPLASPVRKAAAQKAAPAKPAPAKAAVRPASKPAPVTRVTASPKASAPTVAAPKRKGAAVAGTRRPLPGKGGRRPAVPATRLVRIKALDPCSRCGPNTSVEQLYRVDEQVAGTATVHLVFFDRHGWYCVHGATCVAVRDVHAELKAQRAGRGR